MSVRKKIIVQSADQKGANRASKAQKPAVSPSANSPVDQILHLQQTIGNKAVERLLGSNVIQTKLKADQFVLEASIKTNHQEIKNVTSGVTLQRASDKKYDKAALVVGLVIDDKGQPVPDISVSLKGVFTTYNANVEYEEYAGESKTDENGLFKLSFLYSQEKTADLFDGHVKMEVGGELKSLTLKPALDLKNILKALGLPMSLFPALLRLLGGRNPVPFWTPSFYGVVALGKITVKVQKGNR